VDSRIQAQNLPKFNLASIAEWLDASTWAIWFVQPLLRMGQFLGLFSFLSMTIQRLRQTTISAGSRFGLYPLRLIELPFLVFDFASKVGLGSKKQRHSIASILRLWVMVPVLFLLMSQFQLAALYLPCIILFRPLGAF